MNAPDNRTQQLLRRIRGWTAFFMIGLVVSGATAIPLETEMSWLTSLLGATEGSDSSLFRWLARVQTALSQTNAKYPFMAYGNDWLAFAHCMLALVFFWGWREPVRNRWLFDFGLAACALVVPYALVMGAVRDIPLGWRLIDCSFGVFGAVPLWICRRAAGELADSES